MPDTSPRLDLPYLQASQAQKHVTHNEALRRLDALVQLSLVDIAAQTPPGTPQDGETYGLGAVPTGAWAGQAGMLALWDGQAWEFIAPAEGWRAWDQAGGQLHIFTAAAWAPVEPDFQNLDGIGIQTSWDTTNRLALASDAALFSHAGAGHQLKVNKAATGDTASLLFQSDWAGHAEMGLAGSNAFSLKVSDDGSTWIEALKLDPAAGHIDLAPDGTIRAQLSGTALQLDVPLTGSAVQANALDTTAGRVALNDAFGLGATGAAVPNDNLDNIAATGNYQITNAVIAASTLPSQGGDAGSNLWHFQYDNANASQMLVSHPNARCAVRIQDGGVWDDWQEIYAQHTAVGTVTQSNGAPTGALIERGSNANGEYVRYADGTQICWTTGGPYIDVNTAAGAVFKSSVIGSWIFPASFLSVATITITASAQSDDRWVNAFAFNTASAVVNHFGYAQSSNLVGTRLMAVGRWF